MSFRCLGDTGVRWDDTGYWKNLLVLVLPVQRWLALQHVRVDQLLKQAVDQDGQRGEADVVECQVDTVIKSLPCNTTPHTGTQSYSGQTRTVTKGRY